MYMNQGYQRGNLSYHGRFKLFKAQAMTTTPSGLDSRTKTTRLHGVTIGLQVLGPRITEWSTADELEMRFPV